MVLLLNYFCFVSRFKFKYCGWLLIWVINFDVVEEENDFRGKNFFLYNSWILEFYLYLMCFEILLFYIIIVFDIIRYNILCLFFVFLVKVIIGI